MSVGQRAGAMFTVGSDAALPVSALCWARNTGRPCERQTYLPTTRSIKLFGTAGIAGGGPKSTAGR
jgi:hypothetical protein